MSKHRIILVDIKKSQSIDYNMEFCNTNMMNDANKKKKKKKKMKYKWENAIIKVFGQR